MVKTTNQYPFWRYLLFYGKWISRNTLPRPEPQSDEVTLLWRLGAVCGCCLLVLLALVMVNPWEVKRWDEVAHILLGIFV